MLNHAHIGMVTLLLTLFVGCAEPAPAPMGAPAPPGDSRPPARQETAETQSGTVTQNAAATLDGEPLGMDQLHELLVKAHGLVALNQLVASEAVQRLGRREGVTITEQDVQAENARTLAALAPGLERSQQEQVLERVLKERNMPRVYWDMTMRRNAILRLVAVRQVKVTEPMLQEEFNRQYGQRVQIRHIQVATAADAQKILDQLARGSDFAELARQYSINADTAGKGGLFPLFTRKSMDVSPILVRAAFELEDGQVSEILQVDRYFHVIRREKTEPPQDVKFEDVRAALEQQVTEAVVQRMQMQLLGEVLNEVNVNILNPELRNQATREQMDSAGKLAE